jgi:hypothetical protein
MVGFVKAQGPSQKAQQQSGHRRPETGDRRQTSYGADGTIATARRGAPLPPPIFMGSATM